MKKREEFRERVRAQTRRKKGRVAKLLEVLSEEIVSTGHDASVLKEMIVAVAVEEIDRGETTTQATVVETMIVAAARQNEDVVAVSDDMMTMTTDEAVGVRNDEQALLEQLLQGNGMEENCEEHKDVEEKYERDGLQKESAEQNKGGGGLYGTNPRRRNGGGWERRRCYDTGEKCSGSRAAVFCDVKVGGGIRRR